VDFLLMRFDYSVLKFLKLGAIIHTAFAVLSKPRATTAGALHGFNDHSVIVFHPLTPFRSRSKVGFMPVNLFSLYQTYRWCQSKQEDPATLRDRKWNPRVVPPILPTLVRTYFYPKVVRPEMGKVKMEPRGRMGVEFDSWENRLPQALCLWYKVKGSRHKDEKGFAELLGFMRCELSTNPYSSETCCFWSRASAISLQLNTHGSKRLCPVRAGLIADG
jgi:hypothetical protein